MSTICFPAGAGRVARNLALLFCALACANYPLFAGVNADGTETADGKAVVDGKAALPGVTQEQPPEYKNWIEIGIGGNIINGDAAQFKQEHRISGDVFGGIQDLHLERSIGKNATLTVDGHAIFDNHDYDVKIDLSQPGLGYIRAGYTEFRSWYDDNGGFAPGDGGTWIPPRYHELTLDRGIAWVELGLRMPDWPEITIHYSHEFRNGDKDSTSWGDTSLAPVGTRKIAPAFRNIDETRDIVSFDASKTFGNTDIDLGMRYEHNNNDDRLQLQRGVGNPATQRYITQNDKSDLDLFNGHMITETRFSDTFWFTAGYSYTTLGSDLSGTRIIGTDYNSMFVSPLPVSQNHDEGFLNLAGTSQVSDHLFNANLFWMPAKDLTLLSGFRYTHENQDSNATFLGTTVTQAGGAAVFEPTTADTSQDFDNFAERLEARYAGINNWLFWAEGEWTEENGNVREHSVVDGAVSAMLNKDTSLLGQKYTIGANWYTLPNLSFSGQYYYQAAQYDNHFNEDLGGGQRLQSQDWSTNDFNIRMTYRPNIPASLGTLSATTRYDYMQTLISGMWSLDGLGTQLAEEHSALITSHVIGETLTWSPLARLYLQGTLSYVLDETKTPVSSIIVTDNAPTVLDFQSDYWTVTGGAGFIIDNKTDFHADYTFYRANDYVNNIEVGMPFGMGATEHTVSASLSRQLTPSVRLMLRYAFYHYTDETSGGHNNYNAHSIFSSLQYRF
jgi:hypothetical protein